MSFSSEQLVARLNALEDSQESIGNASKWLLSQYRDAPNIAEFWKDYMLKKDINTRRKLLAIYLVNHVVQQAKAKKIGQFQNAFGNVVTVVLKDVYPVLPRDLKKKVKRVCDIWRDRAIFSPEVLKSMQTCFAAEEPKSSGSTIPPKFRTMIEVFNKLEKISQNTHAMKLRFDKALEDLDPHSVVYSENFAIVAKIGQVAKDTTNQSIQIREQFVDELESLLKEERSLLDEERNTLGDIEVAMLSKEDGHANPSTQYEEDILPTYEAENDEDEDDDEDGDSDDSNDGDHKEGGNNGIEDNGKDNREDNSGSDVDVIMPSKRQNDISGDNSDSKRLKGSLEDNKTQLVEEYEPEAQLPTSSTPYQGGSAAVTSNIQDLLSKLAN